MIGEKMNDNDKDFLLRSYGEEYGPDAGSWNTSVKNQVNQSWKNLLRPKSNTG